MSDLLYEVTDHVGVIILNRPDAMNSLRPTRPSTLLFLSSRDIQPASCHELQFTHV